MIPLLAAPPLAYAAYVALLLRLGPERLAPLLAVRQRYNRALALYSALACAQGVGILARDGRLGSAHALVCIPSASWPALWLASKFVEYLDTAFVVARGRLPTRLHALHHALTPALVMLDTLAPRPSPLFLVATVLNLATHTCMYAYYSDSARFAPLREVVTRIQIGQHATMVCLLYGAMGLADRDACEVPVGRYKVALVFFAWQLAAFLRLHVAGRR